MLDIKFGFAVWLLSEDKLKIKFNMEDGGLTEIPCIELKIE